MIPVPRDNIIVLDQLEGRTADRGLLSSIEENGILNPLKVYRYTSPEGLRRYALIDGHRRFDAANRLELTEIPIEIMEEPKDATEARTIQVILNRNRKDVKPSHVADAIKALKDKGVYQKDIAKKFGLSEPEVSMYLSFYRGHEKLKKAVDSGRISLSAIEPLLTKDLAVQNELAEAAIRQRTVRAIRALVKTHLMKNDITAPTHQLEEDIDPLEYLALEELEDVKKTLQSILNMELKSQTIFAKMVWELVEVKELVAALENKKISDPDNS